MAYFSDFGTDGLPIEPGKHTKGLVRQIGLISQARKTIAIRSHLHHLRLCARL